MKPKYKPKYLFILSLANTILTFWVSIYHFTDVIESGICRKKWSASPGLNDLYFGIFIYNAVPIVLVHIDPYLRIMRSHKLAIGILDGLPHALEASQTSPETEKFCPRIRK